MDISAGLVRIIFGTLLFIYGGTVARDDVRWSMFHFFAVVMPLYFWLFPIEMYLPSLYQGSMWNSREYQMAFGETVFILGKCGLYGQATGFVISYLRKPIDQKLC